MKHRVIFLLIVIALLPFTKESLQSNIVINELMSWNSRTLIDEDGDYSDWVELYNTGDTVVNLKGWCLSDNPNSLSRKLPDFFLAPSCFVVIYCSGKNKSSPNQIHTDFKIKSEGETIYLYATTGILSDSLTSPDLLADVSFGRLPDGSPQTTMFLKSTPGYSNSVENQLNKIEFSHNPGFYAKEFVLSINKAFSADDIYYTLDGSIPTSYSVKYTDNIVINSRNGHPNIISKIRTNPEESPLMFRWKEPKDEVFKATVLRAATFKNGQRTSPILSATYIVHPQKDMRYSFPVVSLMTDSTNLFDHRKGIYVPGFVYDNNPSWTNFWGTGNYHQSGDNWERQAHLEFFEKDGSVAINQDAGVRIHGGGARSMPEKSLRIYARSEYGKSTFDYQVFPKRNKKDYKRLILRNSGQDFLWTLFADALIQDASRNIGIEISDFQPVIVFINGEYWGIHNLRERYDEYYLQDYCGLAPEDIEILDEGTLSNPYNNKHYEDMCNFIENNDLSIDKNYEIIKDYIDIFNTINYFVHKIFFAVSDWPGNNVKIWRPLIENGKWRWLTFDNDDGLMYPYLNSLIHATAINSESWQNPPWSTFIFRNLMKNDNFKNLFFETLDLRMKTVFSEDNILKKIDAFESLYKPEIEEHIKRWNYPQDVNEWKFNVEKLREFIRIRSSLIPRHIEEYLASSDVEDLNNIISENLVLPNPNNGNFNINLQNLNEISYSLQITDVLGNIIYQEKVDNNSAFPYHSIRLNNTSPGVYFISIAGSRNIIKSKIIIY